MKFDELRSIAHNIADSLGSGIGLLVGVYEMDVFGEASRSSEGFITVDFLTGKSSGATPSLSLARAIALYKDAFADLCGKHSSSPAAFRELTARYSSDPHGKRFLVTIEDQHGHRAVDTYVGTPGRRVRVLDPLGRIRSK
jgi:hypothetical protein